MTETDNNKDTNAPHAGEALRDVGERGFLKRMRRVMGRPDAALTGGLDDDAAMIRSGKRRHLLLTNDMLVEDTHFTLATTPPEALGYKIVAVNVSDIAAMAGRPGLMTVGLGAPPSMPMADLEALYQGIRQACRLFGVTLAGGDTVRAERLTLSVTLTGEYRGRKSRAPLRSRMKPGDWIYATGTLGDSAAGLMLLLEAEQGRELDEGDREFLIQRHQRPTPRVKEALALHAALGRMAMMDLSDDLLSSLRMLAELSGAGFEAELDDLPLSEPLLRFTENIGRQASDLALLGGEDFELLFACPAEPERVREILHQAKIKTLVTPIGRATKSGEKFLRQGREIAVKSNSFSHF
ncbi:thiamine-phosphate kinase [Candidatus Sumerlaeota bacterium]|nr:thiamine-phosphate kinase [Candidatus Sumerlaeota bacterium]